MSSLLFELYAAKSLALPETVTYSLAKLLWFDEQDRWI